MNADLKDAEEKQVYLHSKFRDDNNDFYFLLLLFLNKHKTQML